MRLNGLVFRLHATIDGKTFEPGPIKASEAQKITAWTGYGVKEWESKLVDESDPLAAAALVALFAFRTGENVRFTAVEIEDVDSIEATLRDEQGRVLTLKINEAQDAVVRRDGQPVILLDGEEYDPPTVPATASPST